MYTEKKKVEMLKTKTTTTKLNMSKNGKKADRLRLKIKEELKYNEMFGEREK